MMHPDQLLMTLAGGVGLTEIEGDLQDALATGLSKLRTHGELPVVLVDDADQLPTSSLMVLLRLHEKRVQSVPVFSLVMLADPAIDAALTTHQLHVMGTAQFHRLEIPRLAREQTEDYVRHFLRLEGIDHDLRLRPDQLEHIHTVSGGLPGKINDLVVRTLREPAGRKVAGGVRTVIGSLVERKPMTLAAGVAVVLLILLSMTFQQSSDEATREDASAQISGPGYQKSTMEPLPGDIEEASEGSGGGRVEHLIVPPRPALRLDNSRAPEPTPKADGEFATAGASAEGISRDGIPADRASTHEPPAPLAPPPQGAPSPADVQSPTASTNTSFSEQPRLPLNARPEQQPAPAPPPGPTATGSGKIDEQDLARESFLLDQNPAAYTLQILGVGDASTLRPFVERHGLEGHAYYFESRRNGHPWFSLLHGIYPDRASAVAALERLPAVLRQSGAWARSLGSVQEEIRKRKP
jgi:DamX protein